MQGAHRSILLVSLFVTACTTADLSDFCHYSTDAPIDQILPENLAISVARPAGTTAPDRPFVTLKDQSPGSSNVLSFRLSPVPGVLAIESEDCGAVDWVTYVPTDLEEQAWQDFWSRLSDSGLHWGFATFPELKRYRLKQFAVAVLDSGKPSMSCGCMWLSEKDAT